MLKILKYLSKKDWLMPLVVLVFIVCQAVLEPTRTQLFTQHTMSLLMPSIQLVMNGLSLAIYWIGATGCGKSIVINMVPRFYAATEGKVLVDGVDVREYTQALLQQGGFYAELYNSQFEEIPA